MTDGEMAREYNTAKDKKAQIRILSELTLKPEEEIIRILKENGCEVEEKRRGRKPKVEEEETPKVVRRRRRKTTQEEEKTIQRTEEQGSSTDQSAGKVKSGSSADEKKQSSSADEATQGSSTDETKQGSSAIPRCVWIALRERYNYLGYSIEDYKQKMIEQSKELAELLEYLDQIGIKEKDLVR